MTLAGALSRPYEVQWSFHSCTVESDDDYAGKGRVKSRIASVISALVEPIRGEIKVPLQLPEGAHACTYCGTLVDIPRHAKASVSFETTPGGQLTVRTLICDGAELHSCVIPPDQSWTIPQ